MERNRPVNRGGGRCWRGFGNRNDKGILSLEGNKSRGDGEVKDVTERVSDRAS